MTMVKTASMLFGGGSNQRSAGIFRQGSRLVLEFVYVCFGGVGVLSLSLSTVIILVGVVVLL
jgi:hypothetical protein